MSREPTARSIPGTGGEARSAAVGARLLVAAALAVAIALSGCSEQAAGRTRAGGDGVWLAAERGSLGRSELRALERVGLADVFAEVGTIAWEAGGAIEPAGPGLADRLPPRAPVTLVIGGPLPPASVEPGSAAARLASDLGRLRLAASAAGLAPVGVHLDLDGSGDLGRYGETVRALRATLPRTLALSVGVEVGWTTVEGGRELARAADFLVARLHGRAPEEPDDPAAWEPEEVEARLTAIEELETPYLVAVHGVGWASHLGADGRPQAFSTTVRLKPLTNRPGLRWVSNDSLAASLGRVVYTFEAERPVSAADWRLAAGEAVRVTRVAPGQLQDLDRRFRTVKYPGYRGLVVHRLPDVDEHLALGAGEIAAALGEEPSRPDLVGRVVVKSRRADRAVVGFELENRSDEDTDLAATDWNYLELQVDGGYFGNVELGSFLRYSPRRDGREARPGAPGWREPNELRIYTPMVEGRERLTGGEVELVLQASEPTLRLSGTFILPDGRTLELPIEEGLLADFARRPRSSRSGR